MKIPLNFKIEWDREYGVFKRRGWTIVYDGLVVVQLTSFWKAFWTLVRCFWTGKVV